MITKALVVASFGTLQEENQKKAIGQLEAEAAAMYPDRKFYSVWTSTFIRGRLLKNSGVHKLGPEEAITQMHADGIRDVLVLPAFAFMGKESRDLLDLFRENQKPESPTRFERVRLADPLLMSDTDLDTVTDFVAEKYPKPAGDGTVILVGHGTMFNDGGIYDRMKECVANHHLDHFVMGTLDSPELGFPKVLAELEERVGEPIGTGTVGRFTDKKEPTGPVPMGHITLVPFLLTAGNHVMQDLAGDEADSWKSVLTKRGYDVTVVTQGLGEFQAIREMFLRHLEDARIN